MDQKTLLSTLTAKHPEIDKKVIKTVVGSAFGLLQEEIANTESGKLTTPLGKFSITQKPSKKEPGKTLRRILLSPAKSAEEKQVAKAARAAKATGE